MQKNLLPKKFNKGYIFEVVKIITVLNIGIGVFFSLWYVLYFQTNKGLEENIKVYETKIEKERKEVSDKRLKLRTDELYQDLLDKKNKKEEGSLQIENDFSYNRFIHEISKITPSTIRLGSVLYSQENEIVIKGQATDFEYISEFYQKLVSNKIISEGLLQKVQVLPSVEGGNHAVKSVVYFEIKGGKEYEKSE